MAGHLSYEEGKKVVVKGLILLGIVTIAEVLVALIGKGYIIPGFHMPVWLMYLFMISMSLYKAYFIVYEFMHMKYEMPGMVKSVLVPTVLLIWALIAFFTEGKSWKEWRAHTKDVAVNISNIPVSKHAEHKEMAPVKHVEEAIHGEAAEAIDSTKLNHTEEHKVEVEKH